MKNASFLLVAAAAAAFAASAPAAAATAAELFERAVEAVDEGDAATARRLCLQAAQRGDANAQELLGFGYLDPDNELGLEPDSAEAVRWLSKAAAQDMPDSQYLLGVQLLGADGVRRNEKEALKWFRKAAEAGNADAQAFYGACLLEGTGVAKDEREAVRWLRKAADENKGIALSMLGTCYDTGTGVVKDQTRALDFFKKAETALREEEEWEQLGDLYFYLDLLPPAEEAYAKALDADPDLEEDTEFLNSYAYVLALQNKVDRAEPYARAAAESAPDEYHVADTLGYVLLLKKDLEGAKAQFEKSLRLARKEKDADAEATAKLHLAALATAKRDFAGARRLFKEIDESGVEFPRVEARDRKTLEEILDKAESAVPAAPGAAGPARSMGPLTAAQAVKIGNYGRNIVQAILQANLEREANCQSPLWPRVNASSFHSYAGEDANAYFHWLLSKELVSGVSLPDFAAGGVKPAADLAELKAGKGNVWNVLACGGSADPRTPILWTRNLKISGADVAAFDPAAPKSWSGKLDAAEKPFGDACVVVVRRNGACETIKAADLTDARFFGGAEPPEAVNVMKAGK